MTHLPGFDGVFVRDTPATLWVLSPSRSQEKGNTCQGAREQEKGEEALWEEKRVVESRRRRMGLRDKRCWNRTGMKSEGRGLHQAEAIRH